MKRVTILGFLMLIATMVVITLTGCPKSITKAVYGPDMTPEQIKEEVWADANTVGNVRVSVACSRLEKGMKANSATAADIKNAKLNLIAGILGRIDLVRGSKNPMGLINQYFYAQLSDTEDAERLMIIAGAGMIGRKVLSRINVKVIEDDIGKRFEAADLDMPLFQYAVDGYEKAILDFKAVVEKQ